MQSFCSSLLRNQAEDNANPLLWKVFFYTNELILFVSKEITDSARGMFDRLINHSPSNGKWYAATEGEMQRTVVLKRNLLVWRNIFTIFPLLPLFECQISIGAEDEEKRHRNISSGQQTRWLKRFSIARLSEIL